MDPDQGGPKTCGSCGNSNEPLLNSSPHSSPLFFSVDMRLASVVQREEKDQFKIPKNAWSPYSSLSMFNIGPGHLSMWLLCTDCASTVIRRKLKLTKQFIYTLKAPWRRSGFAFVSAGSGSRRTKWKVTHKIWKNEEISCLKWRMFSLEGWRLLLSLECPSRRPRGNINCNFFTRKINFFQLYNF